MTLTDVQVIKVFETRVSTIHWREDGITKIMLKPKAHVELADSKRIFEIITELSGGKKNMLVVTIAGEDSTSTKEVREFSTTDECSQYTKAEAVVVTSLAHKLLINFMLKFYRLNRPLKMFNLEEDAIEWLYSMKDSE